MPEWKIMRWDESNFDIAAAPLYVRQAYEARKFAFVSDYVRLWALEQYGGLYMDVDFKVYRSFDDLTNKYPAFAGYEGSKYQPVMLGVMASEAHGMWVKGMMQTYETRSFIKPDGSFDMTPNSAYFTNWLTKQGFVADGIEKDVYAEEIVKNPVKHSTLNVKHYYLHVFPVHYFCPVLTTGEDVRTPETYCEHMRLGSWDTRNTWKKIVMGRMSPKLKTKLIKLKRKILG